MRYGVLSGREQAAATAQITPKPQNKESWNAKEKSKKEASSRPLSTSDEGEKLALKGPAYEEFGGPHSHHFEALVRGLVEIGVRPERAQSHTGPIIPLACQENNSFSIFGHVATLRKVLVCPNTKPPATVSKPYIHTRHVKCKFLRPGQVLCTHNVARNTAMKKRTFEAKAHIKVLVILRP